LVQQTAALLLMVAIAAILFNSYLAVDTADGTKVYELSPLDAETEFEDSVIFHDLFQSSVSDIIQLMVIKGQMETNGSFDPYKYIDITEFVSGKTGGADCPVTAVYELEDLIKWGKYGVEYTDRIMSMSDFVNYFGSVNQNSNFRLDADGQLVFSVEGTALAASSRAVSLLKNYLDRVCTVLGVSLGHINLFLLCLTILEEVGSNLREQSVA
jgi:hypothetical protein